MNLPESKIPSFFKHSYVKNKYVFDNEENSFEENILTDYDTPNYVRIMKKFTTPIIQSEDEVEKKLYSITSQKTFYLRCYLPKRKIIQENPEDRIKDVVIMINGLNETSRYDFYDQLGSHFASNNIASILIPTPFHLNRRTLEEINPLNNLDNKVIDPIDLAIRDPLLFYYNFKRSIHEIENLSDRIQGNITEKEDVGFYDAFFARGNGIKVRITLFGFSLGGLRALGCFMKANQSQNSRYHSCIAFNSAADLFKAEIHRIRMTTESQWHDIQSKLNEAINSDQFIATTQENKLILRIFKWLYNRNSDIKLVNALKVASKKFLLVQSAGDRIVPGGTEWNITDPKHGLNRIVVAGVDHIVTIDEKWHHYLSSVGEQLMEFIRNANDSSYSHQQIENRIAEIISTTEEFISLDRKYPFKEELEAMDFSNKMFHNLIIQINDSEKKAKFIELYYQSKGYYPKFPELLSVIMKKKSRPLKFYTVKNDTELRCGPNEKFQCIHLIKANEEVKIIGNSNDVWLHVEIINNEATDLLSGFIESHSVKSSI